VLFRSGSSSYQVCVFHWFAVQKAPAYSIYLPHIGKKLLKIFRYFREKILLLQPMLFFLSVFVIQTTAVPSVHEEVFGKFI
jgi:hypothetical protein